MEEEINVQETKENLERLGETEVGWNKYLALTTAFIAVIAAIATLQSGDFANRALIEKNDAILFQNKASDQYGYYQAKGIKKNLAEFFYEETRDGQFKQQAERYQTEQDGIKKQAEEYTKRVDESNEKSAKLFEKHHKAALAVTLFQIAIALSAISALLKRKYFWILSLLLAAGGAATFILALA